MDVESLFLSKEDFEEGRVLLINKEVGWTSFDVVKKTKNLIKRRFKIKKIKVGHAGTLDPLATGLLIICTGKLTKEISKIQDQVKTYTGEVTLGATTPSFDLETDVDQNFDTTKITRNHIKEVAKKFIGQIEQRPPAYSAIKINGERLYKKARRGESIEIKKRTITISSFIIQEINIPTFTFSIECSKGTYIRSVANDFGKLMNNGGYLSRLCRTKIGNYSINNAITITEFENQLKS
ncbi:MAG: tRNA pseudouridine(55) synthase TruB [Flavobacteriales bacterium]|nr:tRNA pseudouridine(55) synthase TruB [Flavobacteriales bacterium]